MIAFFIELLQLCLLIQGSMIYKSFGGQVCSGEFGRVMGGDYMAKTGNIMHMGLVLLWIWTMYRLCCNCCGLWVLFFASKATKSLGNALKN